MNYLSRFLFSALSAVLLHAGFAGAQAPKLPSGYRLQEDAPASCMVKADLDGDGSPDWFCAAVKDGDDEARLLALLKGGKVMVQSGPLSMCCGSIAVKGAVVDVHSKGMRGFTYYKFRWEAVAGDFRLIGYDTESFGNAANDGSGFSSINMLTGGYEAAFNSWNEKRGKLMALPKVKRKIVVSRKIYLKSFDEAADSWLMALNAKYLPKEVR